jgi:head-tail adaptor
MQIGQLKQRMLLQEPLITFNVHGQKEKSYQDITTVWGRLHPSGSPKSVIVDQQQSIDKSEITIRYIGNIKPNYRLVWSNFVYDIQAILNIDPKNRYTKLLCSRVYLPVFVINNTGVSVTDVPVTLGSGE